MYLHSCVPPAFENAVETAKKEQTLVCSFFAGMCTSTERKKLEDKLDGYEENTFTDATKGATEDTVQVLGSSAVLLWSRAEHGGAHIPRNVLYTCRDTI